MTGVGKIGYELKSCWPEPNAQPAQEFRGPQLRDASSVNFEAGFELTFEDGLSMMGDVAENPTQQLSRFESGAAYV